MRERSRRFGAFSVTEGVGGRQLDVHSVDLLRTLITKHSPARYQPLVRFLSVIMRHRVMIVDDGESWARTHKVVSEGLHPRLVEGTYAPVIRKVAEEALAKLAERVPADGFEIEVEPLMRAIATSALGFVLFGEPLPMEEAEFAERTLSAATEVRTRTLSARLNRGMGLAFGAAGLAAHQPVFLHRSQRRAVKAIFAWLDSRVERMEKSGEWPALFAQMRERYMGPRRADVLRKVTSEYLMLLVAGIETTAAALTTAIAEIASDPEVRERVVAEARAQVRDGETLTLRFPYLNAVFRETLRRHTIVPTMLRQAETDYDLAVEGTTREGTPSSKCPIHILKGTAVRYLPLLGHMKKSVWGNPREFDPERFLRPLSAEQTKHYIPFGFGHQRCPGHALARTEAILILVDFFRRFELETKPLTAMPMERNLVFTNRPVGVRVRVRVAPDL